MQYSNVFAATATLVAAGIAGCTPAPQEVVTDQRTELSVSPQVAAAVRTEMRVMLGSLNTILTALPVGDTASIARAAQASGVTEAADPALEGVLPDEFVQLGTATHQQFDSLSAEVARGLPGEQIIARLGRLTANCVSCHGTYRLTVR